MQIHDHNYQPHPEMPTVKVCAVEDCGAHENDGQETWLGQILVDGEWVDYARGSSASATRWADEDPAARRVVYWTRKSVPVWPVNEREAR
jgi:membrane-bound inhibitor of C-type lysozyme